MIRVLFVCLGNICRSPMAEAVFAHKVREAGLEAQIEADSAGTGSWHIGAPPHHGTRRVLERHGIVYDHQARALREADLDDFHYIVTMDEANLADARARFPGQAADHVRPFLSYAPHLGVAEVPDPYYTGGFDEVFRLTTEAADGLLAAIRRDHQI